MNILMASSEAYPFSKTGGLGDIAGSLPLVFDSIKINSSLVVPLYKDNYKLIDKRNIYTKFSIEHGKDTVEVEIIKIKHPKNESINVYFVKKDRFFNRKGIYSESGKDYADNADRFILFSKAIVKLAVILYEKENLKLDILHINDWQTALSALYVKEVYNEEKALKDMKVVFTVHNLAYQGNFSTNIYNLLNVSWKFFVHSRLEFYGNVSFMKAGIIFSDIITTVSPSYSKEICDEEFGCGLNNLLSEKSNKLYGILNGINAESWNPKTDKYIKHNYGFGDIEKKKLIRNRIYKKFDLKNKSWPLAAMISRFDPQKGLDLIYSAFFELSTCEGNFIFLFSGNNYYKTFENNFIKRANRTKNIKVIFSFDESLAHKLTAASDMYLMPSKFEPCGLNQLYSMRYGSLPIVHSVGGLKDTVINYKNSRSVNKATGFVFNDYSVESFADAVDFAFNLYSNKKVWNRLVCNAMGKDYSLLRTALEYKKLYKKVLNKK